MTWLYITRYVPGSSPCAADGQVKAQGIALYNSGAACRISVPQLSVVRLEDFEGGESEPDKRLVPGTLVVLSTDKFASTCYVAVMASNDELYERQPCVDIF